MPSSGAASNARASKVSGMVHPNERRLMTNTRNADSVMPSGIATRPASPPRNPVSINVSLATWAGVAAVVAIDGGHLEGPRADVGRQHDRRPHGEPALVSERLRDEDPFASHERGPGRSEVPLEELQVEPPAGRRLLRHHERGHAVD